MVEIAVFFIELLKIYLIDSVEYGSKIEKSAKSLHPTLEYQPTNSLMVIPCGVGVPVLDGSGVLSDLGPIHAAQREEESEQDTSIADVFIIWYNPDCANPTVKININF